MRVYAVVGSSAWMPPLAAALRSRASSLRCGVSLDSRAHAAHRGHPRRRRTPTSPIPRTSRGTSGNAHASRGGALLGLSSGGSRMHAAESVAVAAARWGARRGGVA